MVDSIDRDVYADVVGYLGSKAVSGAFQAIIAHMPPHDCYIETHLGSGAVILAKPLAARSIGIDRDEFAVKAFRRTADEAGRADVELHVGDCTEFLGRFDFAGAGRTVVYADPPYLATTRSSRKRYRFEYDETDHVRLLDLLRTLPAAVIVSGYPSSLYDELVGDWRTFEYQVMTRGGPRTEKLWMNYETDAVHWGSFAGRDYIDRQRIKRKAARWATKYEGLPPGERTAILAALLEAEKKARRFSRRCSKRREQKRRAVEKGSEDMSRAG